MGAISESVLFHRSAWTAALVLVLAATCPAQGPDLTQMQIEDLMNVKVTSVSKREQTLSRTAAAIFVITQEDIRRSGATNLPDLLRMAPGVDVRQIDANAWAISVRGFATRYANKVLVLIDGRSMYTPSFSGVFWEQLDLPLEDIDRIEIIRGPGATVWGANAVNGVISIITKSAHHTQGGLAAAAAGSQMKAEETLQYGGTAGANGAYRVFGKYFNVGDSVPGASDDHWQRSHGGFRSDWDLSPGDSLMVQGDLFANQESQVRRSSFIPSPTDTVFNQALDTAGGDVLARWDHTFAGGSQASFQTYYDTYRRTDFAVPEVQRTFDFDFQDHVTAGDRHEIVWGAGYRSSYSALSPGYWISASPAGKRYPLYSTFFQDEIRIGAGVWLTVGCKLEHNAYTGFQTEPSVRLMWAPSGRSAFWASAAKSVRQPSRADSDIALDLQAVPVAPETTAVIRLYGNPQIQNEEARDFEAGYRTETGQKLSFDLTGFMTFYRRLTTDDILPPTFIPGPPAVYQVTMVAGNGAEADDYGAEAALTWSPSEHWRLSSGYSYLHPDLRLYPFSTARATLDTRSDFPRHTMQIRSSWNLGRRTEFDQALYYTARLPESSSPATARVDVRLARRLGERTEISAVGQNLLRPRSFEYGDSYGVVGTPSVRSVYGKITWRF